MPFVNKFDLTADFTAPSPIAVAVTPANATLTNGPPRALYIGVTGDLVVTMPGAAGTVTFAAVPAGSILPIQPIQVNTGTTASSIVALY